MKSKRMFDKTVLLAGWLAAGGIGISHANLVDITWAGGAFSRKASIAPKEFLEVCGKLKKDESIAWRFSGSAPTDFNIHYHVGKDMVFPEKRKQIGAADGTLVVPLDQNFCWMWNNRSAQPINIEVQLTQGGPARK